MKASIRTSMILMLCALAACQRNDQATAPAAPKPDILAANVNPSINPGDDFFEFANGGWLAKNPIPASEAYWGIGKAINEELYEKKRDINLKAVAAQAPAGSEQRKLADFWETAMDTDLAERAGAQPLGEWLKRIDAAKSVPDIVTIAFDLRPIQVTALFYIGAWQDEKNSDAMSVHAWQGGLGLPDRDYYFNDEQGVVKARTEYVPHIARTLQLLGKSAAEAEASAAAIMKFETLLAKDSRELEDLRDPEANYNRMSPAELRAKYDPSIDWPAHLTRLGIHESSLVVGQPAFFKALDAALQATPVPVLQDYLRFHLAEEYGSYLSKAFDDEAFSFRGKVLNGQQQQRERWKRVLDAEEDALGMLLGKLFVGEFFPEKTRQRYVGLVEAIRTAYRQRIDKLDWMSPATKARAQAKLAAMTAKVGYPDKWRDYSTLFIARDAYAANVMNAARWRWAYELAKLGKPVDRSEWEMTPQTYNAYYNPSNNEIVLPAAIFSVPGRRDDELDDALVYGYAAASTIGHEITHGFDDQGRQFDEKGNLADWWTADDARRFKERAQKMMEQFDAYEPLPGLHINGKASLGENIADYGGVLLGLDAFKQTEQYRKNEKIGGYTPVQRYFMGYALGWLVQQREERLRSGLLSDFHSPPKWRVLGPMANIPDFYTAFDVKPGQAMRRADDQQVHIW